MNLQIFPCRNRKPRWCANLVLLVCGIVTLQGGASPAGAQIRFEVEPINYGDSETDNPVARLQQQIDDGQLELKYDGEQGYLKSLLEHLKIPEQSQMLVFSKTSFQLSRISPKRPRAVYFNDHTYVGSVQRGDVLEVSTVDPQKGAIFYTLKQAPTEKPHFIRDRGNCLTCHANSRTQGVPGHLVRSVVSDVTGNPLYGEGTHTTDQESEFRERWGGWYVTGTHGDMTHMGNLISRSRDEAIFEDPKAGLNREKLDGLVDTSHYLQPTSDIVALMVLEHQTQMHNFLTLANFETRSAIEYNRVMNKTLEREPNFVSESTKRRIESAAQKVVDYMLFIDEFQLTSPVHGSSGFTEEFSAIGPRDSKGRSLRELDLQTRLFKFPCSYLIYSEAFAGLPQEVKSKIVAKLGVALGENTAEGEEDRYSHLSSEDKRAIREILIETKPDVAEGW